MTPLADLQMELQDIDCRRAIIESLMESGLTSLSLENEAAHLFQLKRIAERLMTVAGPSP